MNHILISKHNGQLYPSFPLSRKVLFTINLQMLLTNVLKVFELFEDTTKKRKRKKERKEKKRKEKKRKEKKRKEKKRKEKKRKEKKRKEKKRKEKNRP